MGAGLRAPGVPALQRWAGGGRICVRAAVLPALPPGAANGLPATERQPRPPGPAPGPGPRRGPRPPALACCWQRSRGSGFELLRRACVSASRAAGLPGGPPSHGQAPTDPRVAPAAWPGRGPMTPWPHRWPWGGCGCGGCDLRAPLAAFARHHLSARPAAFGCVWGAPRQRRPPWVHLSHLGDRVPPGEGGGCWRIAAPSLSLGHLGGRGPGLPCAHWSQFPGPGAGRGWGGCRPRAGGVAVDWGWLGRLVGASCAGKAVSGRPLSRASMCPGPGRGCLAEDRARGGGLAVCGQGLGASPPE